jgi:predicted O-linked N-acetylglucosamine transferase (SPINDLY family)
MSDDDKNSLIAQTTRLLATGQFTQAETVVHQLLNQFPHDVQVLYLQSILLFNQGRVSDALASMERVVQMSPSNDAYWNNFSGMLIHAGLPERAVAAAEQSMRLNPASGEPLYNLGTALQMRGNHVKAADVLARAVAFNPNDFDAWNNLGLSQQALSRLEDSIHSFGKALEIHPHPADVLSHLALSYSMLCDVDAAISLTEEALTLSPDDPAILCNLGNLLKDCGRLSEAIACYRKASDQGVAAAHSNLIYCMLFQQDVTAAAQLAEARRYNDRFAKPLTNAANSHPARDPAKRPLRIGYISPDFREHPAGRILRMLLSNHDRTMFEVFCYSDVQAEDGLTRGLKSHCAHWRHCVGMSDHAVAEQIRADRIDVLIDCAMHMANNRLLVFARKPAAMQISWLAYPGTSGLDAMDFRITDRFLDPPDQLESYCCEPAIELPDSWWCIDPNDGSFDDLSTNRTNTSFTFGCLNNFCKLSDGMLACWAKLLLQVPDASLLVLADRGAPQRRVLDQLTRHGIAAERLRFACKSSRAEYLKHFQSIDISLDTLPYNGHITTLDSLWMGVPVISTIGTTKVGRAGLSILSTAGLEDWLAADMESYVKLAATRAADRGSLAKLRQTLRSQLSRTPLTDASKYTAAMEEAYLKAWRKPG